LKKVEKHCFNQFTPQKVVPNRFEINHIEVGMRKVNVFLWVFTLNKQIIKTHFFAPEKKLFISTL